MNRKVVFKENVNFCWKRVVVPPICSRFIYIGDIHSYIIAITMHDKFIDRVLSHSSLRICGLDYFTALTRLVGGINTKVIASSAIPNYMGVEWLQKYVDAFSMMDYVWWSKIHIFSHSLVHLMFIMFHDRIDVHSRGVFVSMDNRIHIYTSRINIR